MHNGLTFFLRALVFLLYVQNMSYERVFSYSPSLSIFLSLSVWCVHVYVCVCLCMCGAEVCMTVCMYVRVRVSARIFHFHPGEQDILMFVFNALKINSCKRVV